MNSAIFTVCNLAYLPKALVLADSLADHNQPMLKIFVIDRKVDLDFPAPKHEIIWIEDCEVPNFNQLAFKYDITELSTAVKPFLTLKLLERNEKVIFLDPDICMYGSLDRVLDLLDCHPIIVTPHYVSPQPNGLPDSDIGMMRFGSFNLGFFAVNGSSEARSFLNWWSDRCFRFCYFETQFGLSTDQKWVSIAPCFFEHLYVLFDRGHNVAFWNLHERRLSRGPEGAYLVNENYPLIFFHFSSFDEARPERLSKRPFPDQESAREDYLELAQSYSEKLEARKRNFSSSLYGFDYMSGGEYISPTLRRAYACVLNELPPDHNPFDSNGVVGHFAQTNRLYERSGEPYAPKGFGDMSSNRWQFRIVNLGMRLILRILGPNQFNNFSRLLVFLSSYRLNRGLWKY